MTNLSGSLSYRKDSNSFFINETGTNDGWVPLPISVNAKDLSTEDLRSLAERLGGGSKYQIYVDVDNPNASDSKLNTGISKLTPFKTIERALLEVARRSFRTPDQERRLGANGDSFERYTINLAPGEYIIQNTPGGFASISNYPDYQIAANLIQRNRDWIVAESIDVTTGITGETRTTLIQDLLSWVVSIASDLSSLTNRSILLSAREFLNQDTDIVCTNPLAPPNNYFVGIYTSLSVRQQAVLALAELRARCVDAAKNLGFITDPEITINPLDAEQIAIYDQIIDFADTLIQTLQCTFDPRFSSIESYGLPSSFPETGEPPKEFYTMFNGPSRCGVILPRGVSIIGVDLRKVIIRPEYVPDYTDPLAERGAIFKMTGANFFSGFTIKDKLGFAQSHHMLTGFEFSTQDELDAYYDKVRVAFSDKSIYHRAQDAANLLEKNLEWVSNKSIPAIVQAGEINYATVLEGEIFHIIKAIISDLRLLDKQNVFNLGKRFHLTHILPIADSGDRLEAQTFYKAALDSAKFFMRDAINNEANTAEGGVVDESIIVDTEPGARCADVVSAIYSYITIIKNHIDGLYSGNVTADGFLVSDIDPFVYETSIVIDYDNDGSQVSPDINTVVGASPYIFSASLRSEYGMNGIHGDGSKVRGLKSYLAAQFTVISMQRDGAAFYGEEDEVGGFRYKGSRKTDDDDFRHFGYRVSNGAYSQLVSCFCICPAVHYWADAGSEFSITNSTSNFGDVSLYSEGYLPIAYPQDRGLKLVGIIKPKHVDFLENPEDNFAKASNFTLGVIDDFEVLVPGAEPRFPTEARITLNTEARFLDQFPSLLDSGAFNHVYIASSVSTPNSMGTRERYARVKSVTRANSEGLTEIVIEQLYGSWPVVAQDIVIGSEDFDENYDSIVLGRQLYIKRFVDPRSAVDRQYKLVTAHELTSGSLGSKRKPVTHYVLNASTNSNFNTDTVRESFYVIGAPVTTLPGATGITTEFRNSHEIYDLKVGATKVNDLGHIEYELDLDLNSRVDSELDKDPLDPGLVNALNKSTFSRQNITKILTLLGVTLPNLNVQAGSQFINLLAEDLTLQLHKPSIIRCGGQTWEYLGYYNYFTGLPFAQTQKLGDSLSAQRQKLLRIEKTQTFLLGGRVYATGMDEEGNSYVGNTFQDLKTGETEQILRGSSAEVLAELDNNSLSPSVSFVSVTIQGNEDQPRGSLNITADSDVEITGSNVNFINTLITFDQNCDFSGLPEATVTDRGVGRIANASELRVEETLEEQPAFVTPEGLRNWRVANKIVSQATSTDIVYVSNHVDGKYTATVATGAGAGDQVSYAEFELHNSTSTAEDQWQLNDPTENSFRCLKSMKDVAMFIDATLTTNDRLTLYIDPGKYQADYTFNCALIISGAQNQSRLMWGNPDGTSTPQNGTGVIFYNTVSPSINRSLTPDAYSLLVNPMIINSDADSSIRFVHFWSWAEAVKDSSIEFEGNVNFGNTKFKQVGDTSLEKVLERINAYLYSTDIGNFPISNYNRFYGFITNNGTQTSAITLRGSGQKTFRHCTFSGHGLSRHSLFKVEDSCTVAYFGLTLRGNVETRIDMKHLAARDGSNIHLPTIDPTTKQLLPSNLYDYERTRGVIDPYAGSGPQLVICGFYDFIFQVMTGVKLTLSVGSSTFSNNTYHWGTTTAGVETISNSAPSSPTLTINSDQKNALKLEKYTQELFGTLDDRIYTGITSKELSGAVSIAYRGTDNLGGYIYNRTEPAITSEVNYLALLAAYRDQGPIISSFYSLSPAAEINFASAYNSIMPSRDTSDLVRSQGILGSWGRDCIARSNNINYTGLIPDYNLESYAKSFDNSANNIGLKFLTTQQYHKNTFNPAWRGFTTGRYSHPVIVDCHLNQPVGYRNFAAFTTFLTTTEESTTAYDYSKCAPYIEASGHILDQVPPFTQFILVWESASQAISVVYLGRSLDLVNHYFIPLGSTQDVGLTEYFSAKAASRIYNTFELAKPLINGVSADQYIYIKSSNLLLRRRSVGLHDQISSWAPLAVNNVAVWQQYGKPGNDIVFSNLSLLGLFCTRVANGFSAEKLGSQISTYSTSGITIPASTTDLYPALGYPTSTFPNNNNTNTLKAYLSIGFNFFNRFSGASFSVANENESFTTTTASQDYHNNLTI